ncbi:DUF3949 domain-containing protein [Paenibacillus sp. EC2-1]|uniref:DUF3949 domain-containing protein n=1 Tax=Paenibacillus sp. EC2-1 TaxID=3388665 RepID=UPI003BEEB401
MIPVQYNYIKAINEDQRRKNKTQNQYYEGMSYQEEQLHFNTQLAFWPSSFVASLIYKARHGKSKISKRKNIS